MDVLYARCAGLDVHKDTVVACVRLAEGGGEVRREVRSFATTTRGLLELSDWMTGHGCTHVAMEATGVYWKPVWHVLEGSFELVLANAGHIRNVPGRKTDVNDATWIADLLAHGLIRGSFVPPAAIQHVRDLTRTRKQLVREVAQHTQRIQKTLEDANIKLTGTISDVLGWTGRHPRRPGRGRDRARAARRPGPPRHKGATRQAGRSAARAGDRASSLSSQAAPGPSRRAACRHRRARCAAGKSARGSEGDGGTADDAADQ